MKVFSRLPLHPRAACFSALMLGFVALMHACCWFDPAVYKAMGGTVLSIHGADLHCLLAASDSHALGLSVYPSIPLDFMGRPHTYSSWWFGFSSFGMGLGQLNLLVWGLAGAFTAVIALLLRPANLVEAGVFILLLSSYPIVALVERMNVDLLMFLILYVAAFLLGSRRFPVLLAGLSLLLLGVGLKYYPAAALVLLLGVGDRRRKWCLMLVAFMGLLGVLWSLRKDFNVTLTHVEIPYGIQGFGAAQLGEALGCGDVVAFLLIWIPPFLAGLWAWRLRSADVGMVGAPSLNERLFVAGASVLCFCHWALINHHYRWVFSLLLIPLLLEQAKTGSVSVKREAKLLLCLLIGLPWLRSACCLYAHQRYSARQAVHFYTTLDACSLALQLPVMLLFLLLLVRLVRFVKPHLLYLISDKRSALAPAGLSQE